MARRCPRGFRSTGPGITRDIEEAGRRRLVSMRPSGRNRPPPRSREQVEARDQLLAGRAVPDRERRSGSSAAAGRRSRRTSGMSPVVAGGERALEPPGRGVDDRGRRRSRAGRRASGRRARLDSDRRPSRRASTLVCSSPVRSRTSNSPSSVPSERPHRPPRRTRRPRATVAIDRSHVSVPNVQRESVLFVSSDPDVIGVVPTRPRSYLSDVGDLLARRDRTRECRQRRMTVRPPRS